MAGQNQKNQTKISSFLSQLFKEAELSPGTHPYPPIVRVGGTHGTIARARSVRRSGDLGFGPKPRKRDIARERERERDTELQKSFRFL